LKEHLSELEVELRAAKAREEINLILPRVVHEPPPAEKKTTFRKGSPRGKKKNT